MTAPQCMGHDWATASQYCRLHCSRHVTTVVPGPPNSPDLNPVDYAIWSILQQRVYQTRVHDIDELRQRLITVLCGLQGRIQKGRSGPPPFHSCHIFSCHILYIWGSLFVSLYGLLFSSPPLAARLSFPSASRSPRLQAMAPRFTPDLDPPFRKSWIRPWLEQCAVDDAIDQWQCRLRACVDAEGGHFEHNLGL